MIHRRVWLSLALALCLATLSAGSTTEVAAAGADWSIPAGRQFTQAGSYSVVDDDGARFWSEFQRLGGVARVGYPVSTRFVYKGFTTQVFQKHALQWRADEGRALFVNIFDELTIAGDDDWLLVVRSTPRPIQLNEKGMEWKDIVAGRLALLDENPAIREAYFSTANPIDDHGLPTSAVQDFGPLYALRTQRAVLQQWKADTAWARAGQVVVANGGDVAKEVGLWPTEATGEKRETGATGEAGEAEATGETGAIGAIGAEGEKGSTDPPILRLINQFRVAAGASPARIDPSLEAAAQNHVRYYDANRGDPSLAGMGLHSETPGRVGFTGATMGARAKAAGYTSGTVTENAGWGKLEGAIKWAIDTVNHRLPLIHPAALDIGYAESAVDGFTIIDVGLRRSGLDVPLPSVYPQQGATNVPVSWDGGEVPNPAPGVPRPLGYPITVAFALNQRVEWQSFSLTGPGGEPLAITTPKTNWMRAAAIVPLRPFARGATYTARVEALVDGKPVTKQWSFTTRP